MLASTQIFFVNEKLLNEFVDKTFQLLTDQLFQKGGNGNKMENKYDIKGKKIINTLKHRFSGMFGHLNPFHYCNSGIYCGGFHSKSKGKSKGTNEFVARVFSTYILHRYTIHTIRHYLLAI